MQQWFALSDPAMKETLHDISSMRQFAGLSLTRGGIPAETTILNFRHLLEENKLAERFLEEINTSLVIARLGTNVPVSPKTFREIAIQFSPLSNI